MSGLTRWMDRVFYSQYSNSWDDQMMQSRVAGLLRPELTALDLGAGRGERYSMDLQSSCRFLAGVDPDPSVLGNLHVHERRVQAPPDYPIPYGDAAFDVVFSNSVVEHVQDPEFFLREVRRVLKPGGVYLFKTPNKWHYVPTLARCTPNWFHVAYNRARGRATIDTFPTYYRCNTPSAIRHFAQRAGLIVEYIETVEGRPEYLRIAAPAYAFGLIYERIVNAFPVAAPLRCVLFAQMRKPAEDTCASAELPFSVRDPMQQTVTGGVAQQG